MYQIQLINLSTFTTFKLDELNNVKNSIMTNEQLKEKILTFVPKAEVVEGTQYLTVSVNGGMLHELCKKLKEDADTSFDYLFCLSGVDYGDALGVVYHLESLKHRHCVVVKCKTSNRENPVIPTVCDIWRTAEFLEREVYDLLGIDFTNHPDMRRLFLEDNWVGHPLRKDYVDEVNMIER